MISIIISEKLSSCLSYESFFLTSEVSLSQQKNDGQAHRRFIDREGQE